jgi:hypothetical protein
MATTSERGYGPEHQRLRAAWKPKVDAGLVDCWRCTEPIDPGSKWELGHDDHDRSKYRGPEHFKCNRSAGGAQGAAAVHAKRSTTVREW